jgi:Flp pilus assembly protein TadD
VRKAEPSDVEAQHKAKDLAANETILRGGYQEAVSNEERPPAPGEAEKEDEETPHVEETSRITPAQIVNARVTREAAPLQARIKGDPTNPHAYLNLAAVYRRSQQFDKAREVLEEGLAASGQNFELSLALTELAIEPFRRNLALAEEKLKTEPEDEEVRKIRIRLLKEINTRELDLFRQKADRYPTDMTYRYELGVRLLRAGQVDEAIRELQATRADPRNQWRSLLYLGYCFKTRNNWRLAQRNFEEALAALPAVEDAAKKEILFQLASGAADSGDLAKAVDLAHELANLDFAFRDIGRLLDEWQERLQKEKADVSG